MALFEWNAKFSVGIDSIDNQHKRLVGYINQLHDGIQQGKGAEVLTPILDGLLEYTIEHFKNEENLFVSTNYAENEKHREEHQALVLKVQYYRKLLSSGKATLSTDLLQFLKEWLMIHILGSDMKYKDHFLSRGIG